MAYRYPYNVEEEKAYTPHRLPTNRSMWKLMILSVLTLGLYGIFFFIPVSFDIDKAAPRPDRTRMMNYLFAYLLSLFTFSIFTTVWQYQLAVRVEEGIEARRIDYDFSTQDFWRWFFLGSFILIGPFVYFHKLCKALNLLCEDYNNNPNAM